MKRFISLALSGLIGAGIGTAQAGEPAYPLTTVSWVIGTRHDLDQDDRYVTLVGRVTRRLGDEAYLFTDGTGTIQLDSERFELPLNTPLVLGGRIDQAFLGLGHLEIDVRQWHYAKRRR